MTYTATVTTVQSAVKAAIDAIPTNSRPFPFTTRTQEADVSQLPGTGDPADIIIGFEASGRLGRTGSTVLEQHLIPVTIKKRYEAQSQSDLNVCHALAEVIRDNAATVHNDALRVDQLMIPHPFDQPQATAPGQYVHRFVLDMDVLRRVVPVVQDTTTEKTALTLARQAAWNAVNNWPEWDDTTWKRKFVDDDDLDELSLHDPGEFDLPALAFTWGQTSPKFLVHIADEWPSVLIATAWFPAHQTTLAEYRANQIVRAIWQCAPDGATKTYIVAATGRYPERNSPISLDIVELGRGHLKALKLSIQFTFTSVVSPMKD